MVIKMAKAAGDNQKLKMLYLADILLKETDEEHPLNVYELSDKLELMGVNANRKTLADDIAMLEIYGMDIISKNVGKTKGYYIGNREFELTELKLLADAVSSARFITERKSRALIKKLEKLGGAHGGEIKRRVFISDRVKSVNEMIYINVDTISQAIEQGCMIKFRYFRYGPDKKKVYSGDEKICSPYALTWSEGNYYTVAYYSEHPDSLTNFRVDRMEKVMLMPDMKVRSSGEFDLSGYMNTSFSMFSGCDREVTMRFDNSLAGAVIDKFGMDKIFVPCGDDSFTVSAKIKTGAAFYGWMFQFGNRAEIIGPENIRTEFSKMLRDASKMYKNR